MTDVAERTARVTSQLTGDDQLDPPSIAGRYVYGIVRGREHPRFEARAIGDEGSDVYTVHEGDLAAVVSDSSSTEYESSRRNMMAHTVVLEEVMRNFTLLPVRFSTVAADVDAIKEKLLRRRAVELRTLLADMESRVEVGLKAFWREGVVFREIVDENAAIRRLRDSLEGRSIDETHYDRIRLGELVDEAMWKKRDSDAERILSSLRSIAVRSRGHKVVTDRMVLNAAFLVDHSRQEAFDAAVTALDESSGDRMVFKYVGPVPPYNFVNIVVHWDQ